MLSRRSLFSFFAGVGAIAAGAKVVEASPADMNDEIRRMMVEDMERGVRPLSQATTIMTDGPMYRFPYNVNCRCVIVEHEPVNMRSDGSIRHRQHHPVDFPSRR